MSDADLAVWREALELYDAYRNTPMDTEQWKKFTSAAGAAAEKHRYQENPLAFRLIAAVIDTMDDLYKGGKTPEKQSYFGRNDL